MVDTRGIYYVTVLTGFIDPNSPADLSSRFWELSYDHRKFNGFSK